MILRSDVTDLLMESVAFIVADMENGDIFFASRPTEQLFGYMHGEMEGMKIESLLPTELRSVHVKHRAGYSKNPASRPMGAGTVFRGQHRDGSEVKVQISLTGAVMDKKRSVLAVILPFGGS